MNSTWWVDPEQLDEDQKEVVKLGSDGSFLILGPPGSGKTNLLVLRANYMILAGLPNVLILTYTRVLREFLVAGAVGYSFPADKIQTFHSWARALLEENGIQHERDDNFDADKEKLQEELDALVHEKKLTNMYDVILLDEAHDYSEKQIELFFTLAKNVFAVGDSRQQIYDNYGTLEAIGQLVDETKYLRYHYRNGTKICGLADGITGLSGGHQPLLPTSNYDEGAIPSSVNHTKCQDLDEQCERMIADLATQMEAYPDEMLGVICPLREDLARIKTVLQESPLAAQCIFQDADTGYGAFDPTNRPICVSTLHAAKGLEFRALHILACETLKRFRRRQRNMAYTGVTRAKTSLTLYYSDGLPGYLESALAAITPNSELPSLADAFGRSE